MASLLGFRLKLPPYTFHIVSSIALTSFAFHHLHLRSKIEEDRIHFSGRTTILEGLVGRIRNGEQMQVSEVDRLRRLTNAEVTDSEVLVPVEDSLSWREVILGRKSYATVKSTVQPTPDEEIHAMQKEWDAGKCSLHFCSLIVTLLDLHIHFINLVPLVH